MKSTKNIALAGLFVSIMLILGYIEKILSLGLGYGIKLGLSNCVLLMCIYWFGAPLSILLMAVKVFLSTILFGRFDHTFLLSLSGGVLSMAGMLMVVYLLKDASPVGAGVIGGVLHNVGQLVMAMYILRLFPVMYPYIALLVVVGGIMGGITGALVVRLRFFLPYERRKQFGFL